MSPRRGRFLVLAIGIAALGAYLLRPGESGTAGGGAPRPGQAQVVIQADRGTTPVQGATAQVRAVVVSPQAPGAEQGDEALSRALRLQHPESTELVDQIRSHSQEELELKARIVGVTGAAPPPAVEQLFALRRAGAGTEELLAYADRELASPAALRTAVRGWIAGSR